MNYGKRQPIASATQQPPVLRRKDADGEIVEEKISPIPYTRKFVTPAGNVIRVPLATGRTIGRGLDNVHGQQKMREKLAKGFLLYSECPYANKSLDGKKACKGNHPIEQQVVNSAFNHKKPPGPGNMPMKRVVSNVSGAFWRLNEANENAFWEEHCCEHMEPIIERRQAKHAKKQAEFADQFKTQHERYMEAETKRIEAKSDVASS